MNNTSPRRHELGIKNVSARLAFGNRRTPEALKITEATFWLPARTRW